MPGVSDLEENKIFADIAFGGSGKGDKTRVLSKSGRQKYRDCPLWDNIDKKKATEKAKKDKCNIVNK